MSKVSKEEVKRIMDELDSCMNKTVDSLKLEELAEDLLKKMTFWGAGERDVEATKKWLLPALRREAKKIIVEKFKESRSNK